MTQLSKPMMTQFILLGLKPVYTERTMLMLWLLMPWLFFITRSLATMTWNMWHKQVLVFHQVRFLLPALSQCWEIIEMRMFPKINSAWQRFWFFSHTFITHVFHIFSADFKAYAELRPEYAKLFHTYTELQSDNHNGTLLSCDLQQENGLTVMGSELSYCDTRRESIQGSLNAEPHYQQKIKSAWIQICWTASGLVNKEINPSLAKPPLNWVNFLSKVGHWKMLSWHRFYEHIFFLGLEKKKHNCSALAISDGVVFVFLRTCENRLIKKMPGWRLDGTAYLELRTT